VFVITQIVITLLLAASLKSMWNLLNVAQVIAYLRLITLWPANGLVALEFIEDGITLRKITKPMMEFGTSSFSDLNTTLDDVALQKQGIENPSLVKSLGIFFFAIIVIALLILAIALMRRLKKKYELVQKAIDLINKKLYYNGFLRYMVTGNLKLTHSGFSFVALAFATTDKISAFNLVLAIGICLLIIAWPIFVAIWMEKHKDELLDADLKHKFGTLYQGTKIDERSERLYTVAFSVRRMLLVLSVVCFPTHMFLRVQCFLWLQSFYIIYVGWVQPHEEALYNFLEIFNESLLLVLGYHLFIFTPFVGDVSAQYTMGWSSIAIIVLIIGTNAYLMGKFSYQKLRMKYYKRKHMAYLKKQGLAPPPASEVAAEEEKKNEEFIENFH